MYVGSVGMKGDLGEVGPRGPTGANGTTGEPGMKGDMGMVGPPGAPAAVVGGVTYTRWGNANCRSGVTLVYAGRTGVTLVNDQGGAANYLCMPDDPEYTLSFQPGVSGFNFVYGTEYEVPLVPGRGNLNSACAVCYIPTQNTVMMIPAKTTCPAGWTSEYIGYLMSEARLHRRTMYECVDMDLQGVPGTESDVPGGHFYHVEGHCNGLSCPPYNSDRELNCVVCSR